MNATFFKTNQKQKKKQKKAEDMYVRTTVNLFETNSIGFVALTAADITLKALPPSLEKLSKRVRIAWIPGREGGRE